MSCKHIVIEKLNLLLSSTSSRQFSKQFILWSTISIIRCDRKKCCDRFNQLAARVKLLANPLDITFSIKKLLEHVSNKWCVYGIKFILFYISKKYMKNWLDLYQTSFWFFYAHNQQIRIIYTLKIVSFLYSFFILS